MRDMPSRGIDFPSVAVSEVPSQFTALWREKDPRIPSPDRRRCTLTSPSARQGSVVYSVASPARTPGA